MNATPLFTRTGKAAAVLCLALLLTAQAGRAQSGWVKSKHSYYAQISLAGFASDKYFNLAGQAIQTSSFRQYNLYAYAEYGLTDRLTLTGNMPLVRTQGFTTTENVWGIGDLRLDAKYGFFQDVLPTSLSVGVEVPLARPNRLAENLDGLGAINLPTGDGEWNFWTTLAVSRSLHPLPAYLSLSAAYNFRTAFEGQPLSDQWQTRLEGGYQLLGKLWLQAYLGVQQTIGEASGQVSFVRGEGTAFSQYGAGIRYACTSRWGIGVQYFSFRQWPVARRNLYQAPTLGLSVYLQ